LAKGIPRALRRFDDRLHQFFGTRIWQTIQLNGPPAEVNLQRSPGPILSRKFGPGGFAHKRIAPSGLSLRRCVRRGPSADRSKDRPIVFPCPATADWGPAAERTVSHGNGPHIWPPMARIVPSAFRDDTARGRCSRPVRRGTPCNRACKIVMRPGPPGSGSSSISEAHVMQPSGHRRHARARREYGRLNLRRSQILHVHLSQPESSRKASSCASVPDPEKEKKSPYRRGFSRPSHSCAGGGRHCRILLPLLLVSQSRNRLQKLRGCFVLHHHESARWPPEYRAPRGRICSHGNRPAWAQECHAGPQS